MTTTRHLTLYTYFRSSAATRVRTLLAVLDVPHDVQFVALLKGEQRTPEFTAISPSQTVPALVVRETDGTQWALTQSAAILEYIDEVYGAGSSTGRLLPAESENNARARAVIRSIVDMVVCDMQPLANLRVMQRLKARGVDDQEWGREASECGLRALEGLVFNTSTTGRYCYGDTLSLADIALAPQIHSCIRFGAQIDKYPTLNSIFKHISQLPAFIAADWMHQPDTPAQFRA